MEQFKYMKTPSLGRAKTPSEWKGVKYLPITRIQMSCGGGMGGANWYEYVYRVDDIPSNSLVSFKRYDGKGIRINTAFVVSTEDFTLAVAELDITKWVSMTNHYAGGDTETYYVLIDDGAELELISW